MANTRIRPTCTVPGCDAPHRGLGYCWKHYQRWRNNGTIELNRREPVPAEEQEQFLRDLVAGEWPKECVKWPYSRTAKGYGVATVEGVRIAAHRGCCKIAHGEPPTPEHQAAHSCGKGHEGCINPGHLRWATPVENAADMKLHGTAPVGAANPAATMDEALVREIYALKGIVPQPEIARRYGIPQPTVSDIMRGNAWASVTGAIYMPGRKRGEDQHAAKLTIDQVRAIRSEAARGVQNKVQAQRYGVSPQCVQAIVSRKTWTWVDEYEAAA